MTSIVSTPDTCSGAARFDGTRLPVSSVLNLLVAHGVPGVVEESYPNLPEGWFDLLDALRPLLRREYRKALRDARQLQPSVPPTPGCIMVGCSITEQHEHGGGNPMREARAEDMCGTCGFAREGHRRHHPFVASR